jgi:hypothetical protein
MLRISQQLADAITAAYTGIAPADKASRTQSSADTYSGGDLSDAALRVENQGLVGLILATLTRPAGTKRRSKQTPGQRKLFAAVVRRCEPRHADPAD